MKELQERRGMQFNAEVGTSQSHYFRDECNGTAS